MTLQETLQQFAEVAEMGYVVNNTVAPLQNGTCEIVHITALTDGTLELKKGTTEKYWSSQVVWEAPRVLEVSELSEEVQATFADLITKKVAEIKAEQSLVVVPQQRQEVDLGDAIISV